MKENMHRETPMAEELALLGHDIRSAITDIIAGLALIDDSHLPDADRQQLNRVRATSDSLMRYLEDGLTTLLAQAAPELDQAPADLAQLLQGLTQRWGHAVAGATNIVLVAAPDLPAMITCNHTALDRILSNLISNAITHSGGQAIHLIVTQPTPGQIRFTVTDHGPGFPADIGEHSPNYSALPAWQTDEGHGLGLSIARNLAQRMGAKLDLRNQDFGAMATLTLPIGAMSGQCHAAPVDTSWLIGKHVLVADDSMPQLLLTAQFLRNCGAEITMVRDGTAAEQAILAGNFDLALIDLEMPGRTGLQICTALRNTPTTRDTPTRVVILTAHHLPTVHQSALAAGATKVLVKPITSAQSLADVLCHAMVNDACKTPQNPPPPRNPGAFDRLLDMAGPELAAELLARYQEDLTAVQSKLHAAVPRLDWPDLRAASHVLVALAGTAGAQGLEHSARAFNTAANDQNGGALLPHKDAVLDGLADLLTLLEQITQERQLQRQP